MQSWPIHIVYMPGTVRWLRVLALSFLEHSSQRIRLVANGLDEDDLQRLQNLAGSSPRFDLIDLPTPRPLPHGLTLNLLAARSDEPLLCVCDHDILALNALDEPIQQAFGEYDVLSAGDRPENDPGATYVGLNASSTRTIEGHELAVVFFSLWRRELVDRARSQFGIGFEQVRRRSQLSPAGRGLLDGLGVGGQVFDTAKLLSLAAGALGARIGELDPGLVFHLGGLGAALNRRARMDAEGKPVPTRFVLPELPEGAAGGARVRTDAERARKTAIGDFFAVWMRALVEGRDSVPELVGAPDALAECLPDLQKRLQSLSGILHDLDRSA